MTESMASEPAEPTTRPQDDRVGTVRRLGNSWFVKLVEPASEPWHVVCSDGQQDVSGWQDDESMEDSPVVGYLPVTECVPSLLADPAQTTGLQARLDAALAELAKYEPSPGCCAACNGVGTVPTGYPCEDCYATGHCHDEAVSCDGIAVDAAGPAQTTELERLRARVEELTDFAGEQANARRESDRVRNIAAREAADLRDERDTARTQLAEKTEYAGEKAREGDVMSLEIDELTAERDRLSLLLRGMARKLVAYRKWALKAHRDQDWTLNRVRAALGTPDGRAVSVHAAEVRAERDERQARIDAADMIATRAIDAALPADEALRMIARVLEGKTARALGAALVGDQPKAKEPKPRCCIGPFADGTHAPGCLDACQDCGGNVAEPRRCRCRDAPRAVEEADDAAEPACECFVVPEEQWTRHYDATEPGSMVEQNPNCPVHPAQQTDAAGDLP